MDPRFHRYFNSSHGFQFGNQFVADFSNQRQGNHDFYFQDHNFGMPHLLPNQPFFNGGVCSSFSPNENEDSNDLSDSVLRYIDQILMEEDMHDNIHGSLDLQAKEKSFYEVLGKKYPPSPKPESSLVSRSGESRNNHSYGRPGSATTSRSSGSNSGYLNDIVDLRCSNSRLNYDDSHFQCHSFTTSSTNSLSNIMDGFSDSPISPLHLRDIFSDSQSAWNFQKGVEEASRFLPSGDQLSVNVDLSGLQAQDPQRQLDEGPIKVEKRDEVEQSPCESGIKKNNHVVERDLEEERSSKLQAFDADSNMPIEEFDAVLLNFCKKFEAFKLDLHNAASKDKEQSGQTKASDSRKGRGKKQKKRKEVIDLRTLLITCAQAVGADDRRSANEMLKKIRQHSSPFGDGNQRLAHYIADGLEARLAGSGTQIYKTVANTRATAASYLKAYCTYLTSSPFRRISNFASNKTIITKARNATKVHIIDFGILFGFQWPTFVQRIAMREGGPPELRITGIEFPQPGFRPAERIEDTGRRLAHYAKMFNVPFKYNGIAQNWETIRLSDLNIEKDEFVVVNCMYRMRNLHDETVAGGRSRAAVLNLIRRINPAIFVHGIVNGAYNAPFFVTRFREVLFHFSALFDMLENNIPSEKPERLLIEREIFGREALNVIACEGWERVERPETYKQWQVRNLRAGFLQVPFDREVMSKATSTVRSCYHKDFVIDEDSQWLLLGWKGRLIYGISCWIPV